MIIIATMVIGLNTDVSTGDQLDLIIKKERVMLLHIDSKFEDGVKPTKQLYVNIATV